MIEPSVDKLVELVDSKYTLVVLAAKRARTLITGDCLLPRCKSTKPVSMALYEIGAKKITYRRIQSSIK